MKKKQVQLLLSHGFKKIFPDTVDPKYFFMRKNYKHQFLDELHIICGDGVISVYCNEELRSGKKCEVMIYRVRFTTARLAKVFVWLDPLLAKLAC